MKRHGLTQDDMAKVLAIKPQSVGQMLRGRYYATLDTLYKYLGALNELAKTNYILSDIDAENYSQTFFIFQFGNEPRIVINMEDIPEAVQEKALETRLGLSLKKGTYLANDGHWALVVGGEVKKLREVNTFIQNHQQ